MKTAIVTGAGAGLGAAIAARLAAAGYRVGILDRDAAQVKTAAAAQPHAVALVADVTDEAAVEAAIAEFGDTPDLLVNNAGIVRFGPLLEQSVADFRLVTEVNLVGCYIVSRTVARRMVARGSGAIINITSINAISAAPNVGAYPASKAGIAKLTEQFAIELGPFGIRVNAVAPGFIDAGMSAPIYANERVRAVRSGGVPLRRLGSAADVAEAVLFLASDAAGYITGQQLAVDGGVVGSVLAALPRE